jgi:hypothetical protein
MLATHYYGPGRTIFLAFDSTYRWRYLDEQHFDGFWARLVDRVGRSKQLGGRYPFTLEPDRETYTPGSQVRVTARFVHTDDLDPARRVLRGRLESPGGKVQALTLLADDAHRGVFETSFTAERTGDYVLRVWPGEIESQSAGRPATLKLGVRLPNPEFESPRQDRAMLEAIAAASGGHVFDLDRIDEIPKAFVVRRVATVVQAREDLWDAPLLAGLILTAAALEWVLRKIHRLV